jgi:hypothetical protein
MGLLVMDLHPVGGVVLLLHQQVLCWWLLLLLQHTVYALPLGCLLRS